MHHVTYVVPDVLQGHRFFFEIYTKEAAYQKLE